MAGPWEKYKQTTGPWAKYAVAEPEAPDANTEMNTDALSKVRTASGGFLEGIPVVGPMIRGGVERAAAATLAPFSDQDYGEILKTIQEGTVAEKEANPYTDKGSQIAGAVAGTVPMVMAAPAAFGAGSGGLFARSAASAATGAGIGAADAAVRSGGDPEAMKDAALWGGGLGALGPGVGQIIGKGVSAVASRFGGGGGSAAEQAFGRATGADAIDDVAGRLSSMGPDAMPMDLGPNLQRQAGALAATPGRSQELIRGAVSGRQEGAGGRIVSALDDALGQPVDTIAAADDIIAQRSAAAKPLYDAAYAKPVNFTPELESLLKRPSVGKALAKARSLAADEGISSQQFFADVADDGAVSIVNTPDMRQLDLTKRALDDMISGAQRAGNGNEARILTQTKNQLVGMMDNAAPEYKAARDAFSGPSAVLDAMEEGSKAFKNSLTPNQMRTQIMKMGDSEKEAFVQGARSAVADIMGTARNDANAARSAFMKGYNQEKLEILVGKEQATKMLQALDAETAFTGTRNVVTGNSETAARLAAQSDIGAGTASPGVLEQAGNLNFGTAAIRMGDKLIGGARNAGQQKTNEELARLLTSTDHAAVTRSIKLIQAAQKRGDIAADRAKELVQSLAIGAAQERRPLEITVGRKR